MTSQYPGVICFGDSITERGVEIWPAGAENNRGVGWIAHLGSKFQARADVIARGFSGYNTRLALAALPKAMAGVEATATVVLVWFGANDSVAHGRGGQHVPVEEYASNLSEIIAQVKKFPAIPVLITPPPLHQETVDAGNDGKDAGKRTNENTKKYAEACAEVAKKFSVPCINMFSLMASHAKDQMGLKRYVNDGLHLSGFGNQCAADLIYRQLMAQVPELDDKKLVRWFPSWDSVDMKNPSAAFL
eukprot:Plantae.Rhodophyta-Palmaria_palmata.ctg18092.p1 GENE.Plantae.Rhodophyta-Palmaria_palmata.ctg18092~~Plantae.Rhodophyta-Palmaria_palmata.ctg18092.p1  ORF type:complete len:246 (-),score=45.67 Plantae.Rhodophyta-Palmaria_palmata.ctg18092:202-939(-)